MASNCTKMISVDSLTFSDNVRTPECEQIPAMVESLRRSGFKVNHPLVVSEKTDGTYLVLNGNRRGLGLLWLRDNEKETYGHTLPTTGKVPAIVHKGLTVEEEILLRIDHSPDEDRVPLDEWSIFMAIRQLTKGGMDTQERIAEKLGLFMLKGKNRGKPNRSYVQPRVELARLPEHVQDEYRKLSIDRDTTLVRWPKVHGLYKVYNEEYLKGHLSGDGPKFVALWKSITTPPEASDDADDSPENAPRELTPAEAVKRSQSASSLGLKTALLAVTRQSDADLSAIDARLVKAESALLILEDVEVYLGPTDYAQLIDDATRQGNERRKLEADAGAEEAALTAAASRVTDTPEPAAATVA